RRTLLASTNPVHSLSNLFQQDVLGQPAVVCDERNCYAIEIDTKDTIDRSKREIREKMGWFLRFAGITSNAEDFVESAAISPAFEESAMFENMIDLMLKDEYDCYVFDTAPTAYTRRLLGMSKVFSLWLEKMLKSREEARSVRETLSYLEKKEADPLMDYLLDFKDRLAKAKVLLTDPEMTAFFLVLTTEEMVIKNTVKAAEFFAKFDVPLCGYIVNRVLPAELREQNIPEYLKNRLARQEHNLEVIGRQFQGQILALAPEMEHDVTGLLMIEKLARTMFSDL
ncbi:MAG: TRC40/GET3/ArsA family transport-energizing ATPase, partial [Thermodesulfobacteriota bacterium]